MKGRDQSPWLHVRLGLAFFSSKLRTALKEYREFMKRGVDPKTLAFYAKKKQGPILGDPDFLDHIKEKYIFADRKLSTEIPEERRMTGEAVAMRILKETARVFQARRVDLSRRGECFPQVDEDVLNLPPIRLDHGDETLIAHGEESVYHVPWPVYKYRDLSFLTY